MCRDGGRDGVDQLSEGRLGICQEVVSCSLDVVHTMSEQSIFRDGKTKDRDIRSFSKSIP